MIKLLNFLGIVRGIYLEDDDHDVWATWETKSPFVKRGAYVYPLTRVRYVELLDDGTVGGNIYVKRWKYMTP